MSVDVKTLTIKLLTVFPWTPDRRRLLPSPAMRMRSSGSFDPLTNGHLDIICRATQPLRSRAVAVLENEGKSPSSPFGADGADLRCTNGIDGVEVHSFSG